MSAITCPTCREGCLVFGYGRSGIHCAACQRSFLAEHLVDEFARLARRAETKMKKTVEAFAAKLKGGLPCGHTFGDLTWAPGSVTKCGACVAERQAKGMP